MDNVLSVTLDELSNILGQVFKTIRDDLFFPSGPRTIEEQISSKIRGQNSMIYSQQDQISSQAGVIQVQSREINGLKDLLVKKDKEIERLDKQVKSLKW